MRLFVSAVLILTSSHVFAGDQCDRRAELGGTLAVTKYTATEALKENPGTGPTNEVWRILAFMADESYRKLGDSDEQIMQTAKLVERTNISRDWRIELLVFNEFFRALCEARIDVTSLQSVNAAALGACFGDAPPGRADFPACIRAELRALHGKLPER